MRKIYFITALVSVFFGQVQAQKIDQCATMPMDSLLRLKHPELGSLNDFERALQRKIVEIKARQAASRGTAEVVTIPVVVHIVHNAESIGSGRNISEAQVKSQIETLNEDFRRRRGTRGFNDDARGADIEIEFCLSQFNQTGQKMAEPGIDRINGGRAAWNRTDIEGSLKPTTIWDPNKFFNVWVLEFATPDNNLLGYAQFPSQSSLDGLPANGGSGSTDGVVILYASFGNTEKGSFPSMKAPYNLGRTLSHETGHWLGLRHIWGDANCGNDFCDDTPTQASESRNCQKGRVSCGGSNMVENYMDYSDDGCMNIFTNNQKSRMRAVLELSPRRSSLIASNLCGQSVSAKPTSNFQAENRTVLLGGQVRFTDLSSSFPTAWKWEFEGGDPATSTEQNPTVTYSTAGKYKVTLTATNAIGSSSAATKSAYIEVLNQGLCATVTNFKGTASVLKNPTGTGYVAGQNNRNIKAISEYFDNLLGYVNLRGTTIKFGVAKAAKGKDSESVVRVTAWNARGFQNGPGSILETKEIPLRTILDDVANNRATAITFDKNLPLFGLPFHVGVEFDYAAGDSIAITTSKNGEATSATTWEQDNTGVWDLMTRRNGINIANDIKVNIGMKQSIQVAASTQIIDPNQAITLQGRGGTSYNWSPASNLSAVLGPQVTARPTQTTTYKVKGTGDVCVDSASITIYVRNIQILSTNTLATDQSVTVSPNPTDGQMTVAFRNNVLGLVKINLLNMTGIEVLNKKYQKNDEQFSETLDIRNLASGIYIVEIQIDNQVVRRKILKF
jgi:PKD repeat protein